MWWCGIALKKRREKFNQNGQLKLNNASRRASSHAATSTPEISTGPRMATFPFRAGESTRSAPSASTDGAWSKLGGSNVAPGDINIFIIFYVTGRHGIGLHKSASDQHHVRRHTAHLCTRRVRGGTELRNTCEMVQNDVEVAAHCRAPPRPSHAAWSACAPGHA